MDTEKRRPERTSLSSGSRTQYAEVNKYYAEFFPNDPPSRTTLGVAQVPGESRLEITCVAYADLGEKKRIGDPPPNLPFSPGILGCR